jgi:hypothetical protein
MHGGLKSPENSEAYMRPWREYKNTPFLLAKDIRQTLARSDRRKNICFVAGVQRSGTEMLMAALERHPDSYVFHERDPRVFDNYKMRDLSLVQNVINGVAPSVVIVKALLESQDLYWMLDLFEGSKLIWMYRDYNDVINSNARSTKFKDHGRNYIDEIVKDPRRGFWRGMGMTPETLATIREHYDPGINNTTALALFWYYRNMLFFDQGFDKDDRCLLLNYENLVSDPANLGATVVEFTGLRKYERAFSHVHKSSVGKSTPPDITPGTDRLCREMLERLNAAYAEKSAQFTS